MKSAAASITVFTDEAAMTEALVAHTCEALAAQPSCSFLLSGGTSPEPFYRAMSVAKLDWSTIHTALVDERWVDEHDPGSNTALIKRSLLQNAAAASPFTPMKTAHTTPHEAVDTVDAAYAALPQPYVAVLGMGQDAHTASWFQFAPEYDLAIAPDNTKLACAITAPASEVTGRYLLRMTITRAAIERCADAVVILKGQEKLDLLQKCLSGSDDRLPIRQAADALGPRLHVFGLTGASA